ncbi:MAG: OmpA family protein [Cyclobacteriaceae bacterium]|nr:OmpA family protein [Cyclobacteriaceae bacterium]
MSKYYILTLLVLCFFSGLAFSQQQDTTTIWAEGRVLNAETKEPLVARITYQSLPYGNRMGSATAATFSFPLIDGDKYSITVQADGFEPAKFLLDPIEANAGKKVIKDIELKKGSAPPAHPVGHVMRLDNLIFQQGKARIEPTSYQELDILVDMLKTNGKMVIQLEGHTDYLGPAKQNLELSEKRVIAVKDYLVAKGINKTRIRTKAFGGTMPLSREDTPEAHAGNRRVEVRVLQN